MAESVGYVIGRAIGKIIVTAAKIEKNTTESSTLCFPYSQTNKRNFFVYYLYVFEVN